MLSKFNFEFFLKQNTEKEGYNQSDIDGVYEAYRRVSAEIKLKAKGNRKQFQYYMEGQVRKMFTGGLLPAFFELDESRRHAIFDFPEAGKNWAYFEYWQTYYKRKITRKKIWDFIIKTGSILAILLSIIKVIEYINRYGLGKIFK